MLYDASVIAMSLVIGALGWVDGEYCPPECAYTASLPSGKAHNVLLLVANHTPFLSTGLNALAKPIQPCPFPACTNLNGNGEAIHCNSGYLPLPLPYCLLNHLIRALDDCRHA